MANYTHHLVMKKVSTELYLGLEHMPASPVRHVASAVLGKCLYNVNDLRDAPGKQGLQVAKWIIV